ncbi:hypothetical protein B0H17DRAFT_1196886 [Mycena rosella]|uniref:Uncharacterized protein n=1 Tax=Mycena rosella TaxID=1033263 RepID=A0AAD7GPQ2_MYCRO|nr:hypothetical protein B0H17DRAFT_1196886 [Mycena rosella]
MSSVPLMYNWGLPGIDIQPPPTADSYRPSVKPRAWNQLQFSPIGLYDLRRRLGVLRKEPGVFQQYQLRFITADIAWFAAGASTDGQHIPAADSFFPEFDTLRSTLPTGQAGSEARRVLSEKLRGTLFDLFNGRPVGVLEALLDGAPSAVIVIPDDEDDAYKDTSMILMDAMERAGYAEARVQELEEQEAVLISQVVSLEQALSRARESNVNLRASVQHSSPTTPVRSPGRPAGTQSIRVPPPYSPSAARAPRSYSPSPQSPSAACASRLRSPLASSSRHEADPDAVTLDIFITSQGLDSLAGGIRVVLRAIHPVKWQEELVELGVSPDLLPALLNLMSEM